MSTKTLARDCRLSERQIIRIIDILEASGELLVVHSVGRTPASYQVVMDTNHEASNTDRLSPQKKPVRTAKNPDRLSPLNHDKLSVLQNPNPDIFVTPTLTFLDPNPDMTRDARVNTKREQKRTIGEHGATTGVDAECSDQVVGPPKRTSKPSNYVGFFIDRFRERMSGRDPMIGDKEHHLLRAFAKRCGTVEVYEQAVRGFFDDDWACEKKYVVAIIGASQPDRWLPGPPKMANGRASPSQRESGTLAEKSKAIEQRINKWFDPPTGEIEVQE